METNDLIAISGLVLFGLIFGALTAKSSNKREKIRGNSTAEFFHYIASALMATATPAVLVFAVFVHPEWTTLNLAGQDVTFSPIGQLALIIVGMILAAYVCLIPYALIEKPAQDAAKKKADTGWTAQDAKTSGL